VWHEASLARAAGNRGGVSGESQFGQVAAARDFNSSFRRRPTRASLPKVEHGRDARGDGFFKFSRWQMWKCAS